MNDERCHRYAEDPEANAAHLADCAACRAVAEALAVPVEQQPIAVEALPLAPWEGASHRAWPLVAGGALAVLAIAIAVLTAAGLSPSYVLERSLLSMNAMRWFVTSAATSVREAPRVAQVGFGFLFLVVNTVLVLLLRRAPRGIDA